MPPGFRTSGDADKQLIQQSKIDKDIGAEHEVIRPPRFIHIGDHFRFGERFIDASLARQLEHFSRQVYTIQAFCKIFNRLTT